MVPVVSATCRISNTKAQPWSMDTQAKKQTHTYTLYPPVGLAQAHPKAQYVFGTQGNISSKQLI